VIIRVLERGADQADRDVEIALDILEQEETVVPGSFQLVLVLWTYKKPGTSEVVAVIVPPLPSPPLLPPGTSPNPR